MRSIPGLRRAVSRAPLLFLALAGTGVAACSASDGTPSLVVGTQGSGGAGSGSRGSGGDPEIRVGDGGVSRTFSAHIEKEHVVVELVTLSCAGDCAEVEAVASGGGEPYSFAWEDGSANPIRTVCPTANRNYVVAVTDSGMRDGEFRRGPETVSAPLTAAVLDCAGGGAGGASGAGGGTAAGGAGGVAAADAAPPPSVCLENPSFEGQVTPDQFQPFVAPPWNSCYAGGFITYAAIADQALWPTQNWTFPGARDGATYLALGQQAFFAGRASQVLCQPLRAGESRSFLVDLARATSTTPASEAAEQRMQVMGGSECGEAEVLWTSPPLPVAWATYCVTLRPQATATSIAFVPRGTGGGGLMEGLVDHIVPVDACP